MNRAPYGQGMNVKKEGGYVNARSSTPLSLSLPTHSSFSRTMLDGQGRDDETVETFHVDLIQKTSKVASGQ